MLRIYLIAPPPWLQVSDADIGANGQVAFSLSADTQGLFSLNIVQAFVAELTLSHTPDRETRSSYNFRMFATDRGFPALIGETDITIVIGVSTGSICMLSMSISVIAVKITDFTSYKFEYPMVKANYK